MKYTVDSLKEELDKIDKEMAKLNSAIDRKRYVNLRSEVEPDRWHKIERTRKEWLNESRGLLDQLRDLKRDKSAIEYMLKELLEQEYRSKRHKSDPSEMVDLRGDHDSPPADSKTNLEEDYWDLFCNDFKSILARRAARLEKIANCTCETLSNNDGDNDSDYMSKQNVKSIQDQVKFITEHLSSNKEELEDWLRDKISKVADDIDEIYKYLHSGER